jgi:hypothetical protein
LIEANLNDLLEGEEQAEKRRLAEHNALKSYSPEPFGRQLATFYYQLLETTPIDHLHILSIDTQPDKIRRTVEQVLVHVKERFDERGCFL